MSAVCEGWAIPLLVSHRTQTLSGWQWALSDIDSLRAQTTDLGKTLIVGTGVTMVALLAWTQGLNFK
jgi:hypothetical protein